MICHTEPVIQRTMPLESDPKHHLTHPYEVVRPIGRTNGSYRFTWHATLEDAEVAVAQWRWRDAIDRKAVAEIDPLRLALIDALEKRAA